MEEKSSKLEEFLIVDNGHPHFGSNGIVVGKLHSYKNNTLMILGKYFPKDDPFQETPNEQVFLAGYQEGLGAQVIIM
jgi:hypothetical protein